MGSHAFNRDGEPVAGKLCLVDALLPTGPGLAAANGSSAHLYQALPVTNNSSISLTRLPKRHGRGGDQRYVMSLRPSQVMLTLPAQFDIFPYSRGHVLHFGANAIRCCCFNLSMSLLTRHEIVYLFPSNQATLVEKFRLPTEE